MGLSFKDRYRIEQEERRRQTEERKLQEEERYRKQVRERNEQKERERLLHPKASARGCLSRVGYTILGFFILVLMIGFFGDKESQKTNPPVDPMPIPDTKASPTFVPTSIPKQVSTSTHATPDTNKVQKKPDDERIRGEVKEEYRGLAKKVLKKFSKDIAYVANFNDATAWFFLKPTSEIPVGNLAENIGCFIQERSERKCKPSIHLFIQADDECVHLAIARPNLDGSYQGEYKPQKW